MFAGYLNVGQDGAVADEHRHLGKRAGAGDKTWPGVPGTGTQVSPTACGYIEAALDRFGLIVENGDHQQVGAKQKRVIDGATDRVGLVGKVDWTQHRPALG